ncbi:MAG: family 10 glycosylhydrolase [Clostridia bacterium]|nr:family 10 glycosylhydrolase [Clostridiaceae bacterium]
MRYPSAKVHDLFMPQSRGYGRFLAKHDAPVLAVEEAHKRGMEIYGWWRMNNYSLNVVPEFWKKHPEYHERGPDGKEIPKLCFAIPEVRRWKIEILKEVIERGVDGIVLGVLRHPPMLNYHPVLTEGFKAKYGEEPPKLFEPPANPDEWTLKWLFYRAEFLTTLVRELRYEMERMKKGHLKLAVWIRPSCYLYDGVDLDTWLEEGLVHEVIVSAYRGDELPGPLELQKKIQEKAEFHVEILGTDTEEERIKSKIASYANRNVDGICIYESNLAVTRPLWRELISKLWGEKRKE